jgi:salicylate hydroxylase
MTTDKSNMSIAIVGGGLGGVTAAIALGRAGYQGFTPSLILLRSDQADIFSVHIFEQGAEFSELGLGIGIGPK